MMEQGNSIKKLKVRHLLINRLRTQLSCRAKSGYLASLFEWSELRSQYDLACREGTSKGLRTGGNGFGSFCQNKRTWSCGGQTPQEVIFSHKFHELLFGFVHQFCRHAGLPALGGQALDFFASHGLNKIRNVFQPFLSFGGPCQS